MRVLVASGTSRGYHQPPTNGSLEFGHDGAEHNASPFINDYATIDPAFWCMVELSMSFEDGSRLSATLLRPQVWLVLADAAESETIWLELPEMGLAGFADVVSISPAPASIEPGQQAVGTVTGRFVTSHASTLDLYLDSSNTPLGVTPPHPVWSLSSDDWVSAGDLYPGESIATINGPAMVRGTVPAAERTVYNLEVLGHHTYFVGDDGVWVHNAYLCPGVGGFRPPAGTRSVPSGIPSSWRIRGTRSPGGVRYYDPTIRGNSVRVMPGSTNSPHPISRAPYVRWQKDGQALDRFGNRVPKDTPDAHIPLPDFRFRPELF